METAVRKGGGGGNSRRIALHRPSKREDLASKRSLAHIDVITAMWVALQVAAGVPRKDAGACWGVLPYHGAWQVTV